jgi:Lrp/AsnC family leucine-responsive transcriptional regulator
MDSIDRTICGFLQGNGRATSAEVGAAAGVPASTANDRMRRLADAGTIRGWSARLSAEALGLQVLAFVFVLLEKPEHTKGFVAAMQQLDNVQECHHVTGEWSDLLKVRTSSIAELEKLISEQIKSCTGVVRTLTMIALSSPKETASLPLSQIST